MNLNRYTKEQQRAIKEKGHNIIVSAGAGSGKTAVLSTRVSYFIKYEGYHIKDFLILTFTNLAIKEMRERIKKDLENEGLEDYKMVDFSDISTFDAFALSICKKYHQRLGLSANVSLDSASVLDVKKRIIIKEIFDEYYKEQEESFVQMISDYCFKNDDNLIDLAMLFYKNAELSDDFDNYLDTFATKYYDGELLNNIISLKYKEILKSSNSLYNLCLRLDIPLENADETVKEIFLPYFEKARKASNYDELLSVDFPNYIDLSIKVSSSCSNSEKLLLDKYKTLYQKFFDELEALPVNSIEYLNELNYTYKYALIFTKIIRKAKIRLDKYKKTYQIYSFLDIANMAYKLVKSDVIIRCELTNKYKMIMIDEYQDTSYLQDAFIDLIKNDNLFMVGDIKQSIYAFRHARCDLFQKKYDDYKNNIDGVAIDLNKNFRSRKEILEDNNYIFKSIMTKEFGGADYEESHMIEFGNKTYDDFSPYNYHFDVINFPNQNSDLNRLSEIRIIAKDIINKINNHYQVMDVVNNKAMLRDCTYQDFCILIDRTSSFEDYQKIFTEEFNIPLLIEYEENIVNNDTINTLLNIVRMIDLLTKYSNNEITSNDLLQQYPHPFIGVARSYLFNYSDELILKISSSKSYLFDNITIKLQSEIKKYQDYSLYEFIKNVIINLDVYEKTITIGSIVNEHHYIDAFFEKIQAMCNLDYSISDIVDYFAYLKDNKQSFKIANTGSSNSVRLMTIHKSKGLGFNIVYYPEMYNNFIITDATKPYNISNEFGLIMPRSDSRPSLLLSLHEKKQLQEIISEKIRLLYVGFTRPKEKVIITLPSDSSSLLKKYIKKKYQKDFSIDSILDNYKAGLMDDASFMYLLLKKNYVLPNSFLELPHSSNVYMRGSINQVDPTIYERVINDLKEYSTLNLLIKRYKDECNSGLITLKDFSIYCYILGFKFESTKILDNVVITKVKPIKKLKVYEDYFEYEVVLRRAIKMLLDNKISISEFTVFLKILNLALNPSFIDLISNACFTTYKEFKADKFIIDYVITSKNEKSLSTDEIIKRLNEELDNGKLDYHGYAYFLELIGLVELERDIINLICQSINNNKSYDEFTSISELYGFRIIKDSYNRLVEDNFASLSFDEQLAYKIVDICEFTASIVSNVDNSYLINKSLIDGGILDDSFLKKLDLFDISVNNIYLEDLYGSLIDTSLKSNPFLFVRKRRRFDYTKASSFYNFLDNFKDSSYFNYSYQEGESLCDTKLKQIDALRHLSFDVKSVLVDSTNDVVKNRASKEVSLDTNVELLRVGTRLHFVMEMMDFVNPDYSLINKSESDMVKKFLSLDILKNIKDAHIYKEYEFIDDKTNTRGIIDLMCVYDDHIDIIDYKTMHIEDSAYDAQLSVYYHYIKELFKKDVNCYLYSLVLGNFRKCKC